MMVLFLDRRPRAKCPGLFYALRIESEEKFMVGKVNADDDINNSFMDFKLGNFYPNECFFGRSPDKFLLSKKYG